MQVVSDASAPPAQLGCCMMLEARISEALSRPLRSREISQLLDEVVEAGTDALRRHEAARAQAYDPATPPTATAEARKQMEDAEFASARMTAAAARLREMHAAAIEQERNARADIERRAALTERDALTVELANFYPTFSKRLANLLDRIAANDRKLRLGEGTEDLARAAPTDWRTNPSPAMPSLVRGVRLPSFELSRFGTGYIYDGMRG